MMLGVTTIEGKRPRLRQWMVEKRIRVLKWIESQYGFREHCSIGRTPVHSSACFLAPAGEDIEACILGSTR
jgi:hypothetical protein